MWCHVGALLCKAEDPLLLKQTVQAAALQLLPGENSPVPTHTHSWCYMEPLQPSAAARFSLHLFTTTVTDVAALHTLKAALTFVDVSKFDMCVFEAFIW